MHLIELALLKAFEPGSQEVVTSSISLSSLRSPENISGHEYCTLYLDKQQERKEQKQKKKQHSATLTGDSQLHSPNMSGILKMINSAIDLLHNVSP